MFSTSTIFVRLIILFLGIPIHEWAHAWSAYQLGDNTASTKGRLTLNPMAHLHPIGSLLLLFSGFGWGKPVPVNPYLMKGDPQRGMAISSAAGPFSNFVLAMLLAIPFRLGWITSIGTGFSLGGLLLTAININLALMLFNLIPIYPLDGEKILSGLLPPRWADSLQSLRPYSMPIFLVLLFLLPQVGIDLVGVVLTPIHGLLWRLLLLT